VLTNKAAIQPDGHGERKTRRARVLRKTVTRVTRMAEGTRSLFAPNEELNQGNERIRRILLTEVAGIRRLDNGPDPAKSL
jgi:hypothetical protein